MRGKLISAVIATLLIVSIAAGSTIAFAQTATTNTTKNVTKGAVASAVKSAAASKNVTKAVQSAAASAVASAKNATGGFLGLPGFEAVYAVAGLLAVAYLLVRRRK